MASINPLEFRNNFPHVIFEVAGGDPQTIHFAPGHFETAEEFVDANRRIFETARPRGFDISVDDSGHILLSTRSHNLDGGTLPLTFRINPSAIAASLGFDSSEVAETERVPGGSLWIQSGANEGDGIGIEIPRLCTRSLGLSIRRPEDETAVEHGGLEHLTPLGAEGYTTVANVEGDPMEYSLDVTSHEKASNALTMLTNAINIISMERARMGAQQNRLDHARNNVDNSAENLSAAESRIRDVDMALEMSVFVRNQILMQSGTAMLAQANALPQGILQMLG